LERSRKQKDEEEGGETNAIVLEEAKWRLGFAIKDLPVGSGKEKWMDPLCKGFYYHLLDRARHLMNLIAIEALGFLYMDYKPPRPLDVLISPTNFFQVPEGVHICLEASLR
jgi:hypothetical protein